MKSYDEGRHPGQWRMMRVNPGFAGILLAVAFVVLGVVGLPMARWFLLGAILLGASFALIFKLLRRSG